MTKLLKRTPDVVIDGHLSHFIPAKHIDLCFITSCPLNVLKKRLEKRKYSARKVRDNLDCEIFDVCRIEAEENGHRPIVVWTNSEQGRTRPLPAMNSVIV
jgi:adenylate kinase